jgi:hypothetical protein
MTTTAAQLSGYPDPPVDLNGIVITDIATALNGLNPLIAALTPAQSAFNPSGRLYIYLSPKLHNLVGPRRTPDSIAGLLIHEFAHYTPAAMSPRNTYLREIETLKAENPVRVSLGMPQLTMDDLKLDHFLPGPGVFFYR